MAGDAGTAANEGGVGHETRVIPGEAPKAMPGGSVDGHPCSRNIEHMRWVLRWWSMPGETVFDPFMGSGSTGVAAVQLGCRFVGVEISPEYYAIARRRILDAQAQPRLFDDVPPPQPQQGALLDR